MKKNKIHCTLLFLACLLLQSNLFSQTSSSDNFIKKVRMGATEMVLEFENDKQDFRLELVGPDGFAFKANLENKPDFTIKSTGIEEHHFADGLYKIQVIPQFKLSLSEQKALRNGETSKDSPTSSPIKSSYTRQFSIADGQFVLPKQEVIAQELPKDNSHPNANLSSLKLNPNYAQPQFTRSFTTPKAMLVDIVHGDDVIIESSLCLGADCENGETFGSDTQRFKENNLRIHFDDSSGDGGSFPFNDWRILINSNLLGGGNFFAIEDATNNRTPFRIDAKAPTNSFFVKSDGKIGLGTFTPAKKLHLLNGNTPTIRFDQDGSAGFGSQVYDVGANETGFFIQDITNAFSFPFKILPGAQTNTLVVSEGKVGIGFSNSFSASSIEQELHVDGNVAISGSILPVSDARLKKDIHNIENGMETIEQLRPTTYHFRTEQYDDMKLPNELQYGFIAQEIEEVLPDLVASSNNPDKDRNFKRVNYTGLIPLLVKGMQEQQAQIEALKAEIEALKEK